MTRKRTKEQPHANLLFSLEAFQRLNPSRTHLCHPGTITVGVLVTIPKWHTHTGTPAAPAETGTGWSQLVPANTFHCTLMTAGPPASVTLALTPLHGPPGILRGQEGWGEGRMGGEEERSDTDEGGQSRWQDSSEGIGSHEYINWQEGE